MFLGRKLANHRLLLVGLIIIALGVILNLFWYLNYSKNLSFFTYDGWSPNGDKLIFSSVAGNYPDTSFEYFHVLDMETFDFWSIDTVDFSPAWSPDGKKMAFLGDAAVNSSLYVVNANGKNLRKIYTCDGVCEKFYWLTAEASIWIKECHNGTCGDKSYKIIQVDTKSVSEENTPNVTENNQNISKWLFVNFLDPSLERHSVETCPNHSALKTGQDKGETFSQDKKYFAYNLPDSSFKVVETQTCNTIFVMDKNTYFKNQWWHTPNTIRYGFIVLGVALIFFDILRTRSSLTLH